MRLNENSQPLNFNNKSTYIEGWYWAYESDRLKRGQVVGLEILGKSLALYRGEGGSVYAVEGFCPHMGAHFKTGKVMGEQIQCAFHGWKFSSKGQCTEIPCQRYADKTDIVPRLKTYQTQEKYGLIWVHSSPFANHDEVPYFSELEGGDYEFLVADRTYRPCRPEVVMLNAIDAHHFNTVHPETRNLAGVMDLKPKSLSPKAIRFENQTPVPKVGILGRLLSPFYRKGIMTFFLDYWYGSTGVVTLGPDRLHFYLLFPHRPTLQGGTEGIMVFLTRKRRGILGKILSRTILWITYIVGVYFEKGDREIFDSINFAMKAPVKADFPIIEFIRHTEKQVHHEFKPKTSEIVKSIQNEVLA